jgi:hypothetical protein
MFVKIIIFIIIVLIFYNCIKKEKFENNNIFLTKSELEKYLINDYDNYYKSFNNYDLQVRNINSIDDYIPKIKKSCVNISDENKIILNECIDYCNSKIQNYNIIGFDGNKCSKLYWKIGLIDGNEYELGMPHTRNDIIILPKHLLLKKKILISTLIHEKIHQYQKEYKDDINKYLKNNGFTRFKNKNEFTDLRANPDIDDYVYLDNQNRIMRSIYNNNPSDINSIKIVPINSIEYEHPLEFMAYDLQKKILS